MDYLRFLNIGLGSFTLPGSRDVAPRRTELETLDTLVGDDHFRRDIAARVDYTPFVRDDHDRAA